MFITSVYKAHELAGRGLLVALLFASAFVARANSLEVSKEHSLYHFGVGATYKELNAPLFSVKKIKSFGTLGLGALEGDKGEMLVVDGHFYQTDTEGNLSELTNTAKTPIAALTKFDNTQLSQNIKAVDLKDLETNLLQKTDSHNRMYAIRIKGNFQEVVLRAGDKTLPPVTYYNVQGELVGFWAPGYLKEITKPGFHFHFIAKEINKAGHLLNIGSMKGTYQLQKIKSVKLQLEQEN